jgi:hypothetical protein
MRESGGEIANVDGAVIVHIQTIVQFPQGLLLLGGDAVDACVSRDRRLLRDRALERGVRSSREKGRTWISEGFDGTTGVTCFNNGAT